ncbi:MAG: peptidoglycan-binding protein, partial [Patescibacteria group bacterium]
MLKRLAFSGLGFALLVTPLFASAQLTVSTTNDNQTQIQELTALVARLLAQISALNDQAGGASSGGASVGPTQIPPTPSNTSSSCVSISNYLYLRDPAITDRDSNGDVTLLQQFLRGRGYPTRVSGAFDENTRDTLQDFQRDNRIAPEGVTGPITRGKIRALTCSGTATPSTALITGYLYAAADEPFGISGSASPAGSIVYLSIGNNFASGNATVAVDRSWSVYFGSGLPAGSYQVTVRANSSAGAVLTTGTLTVVAASSRPVNNPINPASVPTVEFIGTPTLSLQYDSAGKESALQAEATVKITAGNMPIDAGSMAYTIQFYKNDYGFSRSNSMRFNAVSSIGGDRIPANTSATFRITGVAPTRELLAGTYTLALNGFYYPDLSNPASV